VADFYNDAICPTCGAGVDLDGELSREELAVLVQMTETAGWGVFCRLMRREHALDVQWLQKCPATELLHAQAKAEATWKRLGFEADLHDRLEKALGRSTDEAVTYDEILKGMED